MRSDWLYIFLREIRNPLTAAAGYIELLDRAMKGTVPANQTNMRIFLEKSSRSLQRITDQVNELAEDLRNMDDDGALWVFKGEALPGTIEFIKKLQHKAPRIESEISLALIGDHATRFVRWNSTLHVVMLAAEPEQLLSDSSWIELFGTPFTVGEPQQNGILTTISAAYHCRTHACFHVGSTDWANTVTPHISTVQSVRAGIHVLLDPHGHFARIIAAVDAIP